MTKPRNLKFLSLACAAGLSLLSACQAQTDQRSALLMHNGAPVRKDDDLAKEAVAIVDGTGDLICSGVLIGKSVVATEQHCTEFTEQALADVFVVFGPDVQAAWKDRATNGLVRGVRKLTLHGSSHVFIENKEAKDLHEAALAKMKLTLAALNPTPGETGPEFAKRKIITFLSVDLPEDYDLALLFLDSEAPPTMRPLQLASAKKFGDLKMGTKLQIAGYGRRFPDKKGPNGGPAGPLPDVPPGETAKGLLESAKGAILMMRPSSKGTYAAVSENFQVRLCRGDSGGPGVVTDPADGKRYLMGMTKMVYMDKHDGCGILFDQTDVRTFELWIRCNASSINGPGQEPPEAQCILPRLWAESVERKI